MKKRILPLLLTLTLTLPASSCSAVDTDSDAWKNNTGIINLDTMTVTGNGITVEDKKIVITSGGDFEVSGTLDGGMIYINSEEKVKLRLSGASITSTDGPAIYFDNAKKALITITEDTTNYLSDGSTYSMEDADGALFSNDDLEIKGSGTLTVIGNYKHGIAGDDDVVIENGTLFITSYEHSIKANDQLSVTGGNITATSETGKGMKADLELVIDDGDINVTSKQSEGIESKGTLTINGGNINITAADDGINTGIADTDEDMRFNPHTQPGNAQSPNTENGNISPMPPSKQNIREEEPNRKYPFDEGQIPTDENGVPVHPAPDSQGNTTPPGMQRDNNPNSAVQMPEGAPGNTNHQMPSAPPDNAMPQRGGFGGGFGRIDEETAAAHALTVNGGTIYLNVRGDGIDSNGSLTINGGKITIDGPLNSGNGPIDSDGIMTITGGELIMASSAGMLQLPQSEDTQNTIKVIFSENAESGSIVTVKDKATGEAIASHTPAIAYRAFIFSSDQIVTGNEYEIYQNDTLFETVTAAPGITSAGTQTGMGSGFGGMDGGRNGKGNRENIVTNPNWQNRIKVSIDGKNIQFETDPVIKNDTTLVGFRAILEALGATVEWNEKNRTVTAVKDDVTIVLQIGSAKATVNGEEKTLLTAPEIINNSTMIPVRFVSEELDMNVDWNGETRHISINAKK